ncbi:MAG: FCSD flavin-binding domain-containing protein [Hydrogenobacter sp.]
MADLIAQRTKMANLQAGRIRILSPSKLKLTHMYSWRVMSIVAKIIAGRIAGKDVKPTLPDNTCYSMVNDDPQEAIVISVTYDYNDKEKKIVPKPKVINERSIDLAKATYEWAKSLYRDMFS